MSNAAPVWTFREAIRPGVLAVRHHLRPFLLIRGCAVAIVIAYYQSTALHGYAAQLAAWKASGGYLFSILSTAFAGVVLPEVFKLITRNGGHYGARQLLYNAVVFGFIGFTVDVFYRLLAALLGDSNSIGVVTTKVLLDQFVYSPFLSIPISLTLFLWRDLNFDIQRTRQALRVNFVKGRLLPALIVCWGFWGPVVTCVYALPAQLQFCLFLFAQAAWSLLLIHVSKGQAEGL